MTRYFTSVDSEWPIELTYLQSGAVSSFLIGYIIVSQPMTRDPRVGLELHDLFVPTPVTNPFPFLTNDFHLPHRVYTYHNNLNIHRIDTTY
jgi:hypothetical protein